jgi:hypothetical protein
VSGRCFFDLPPSFIVDLGHQIILGPGLLELPKLSASTLNITKFALRSYVNETIISTVHHVHVPVAFCTLIHHISEWQTRGAVPIQTHKNFLVTTLIF